MLEIHAPEAEEIHDLAQGVVRLKELDRAADGEQHLRVGFHVQRVDGAGVFDDVVAFGREPGVSESRGERLMSYL